MLIGRQWTSFTENNTQDKHSVTPIWSSSLDVCHWMVVSCVLYKVWVKLFIYDREWKTYCGTRYCVYKKTFPSFHGIVVVLTSPSPVKNHIKADIQIRWDHSNCNIHSWMITDMFYSEVFYHTWGQLQYTIIQQLAHVGILYRTELPVIQLTPNKHILFCDVGRYVICIFVVF